jgi:hypothetical protein
MTVAITRAELDATDLRAAATRSKDAAAARRMLALALVMEGYGRSEAARAAGMDRQTPCDWVHRYKGSPDDLWNGPAHNLQQRQACWACGGRGRGHMQIAVLGIDLGKNSCSAVGLDSRRIGQFVRRLQPEACANFLAHAGYAI